MTCHPQRHIARKCKQPDHQLDGTIDQLIKALEHIQDAWLAASLALRELQAELDAARRLASSMTDPLQAPSAGGAHGGS